MLYDFAISTNSDVKQCYDHLLTSTLLDRAMLNARSSHLYFCQSLYTLQRGLAAIADPLFLYNSVHQVTIVLHCVVLY